MAKKIEGYIKLQVPAGAANPSPPIGPALGQRGVNIMEFCKAFNATTQEMEKGMPIPTVITVYADRSFTFETKTPPASFLIKKALGLKSGSKEPSKISAGTITRGQLRAADLPRAFLARLLRARLDPRRLLQQEGGGRGLGREGERTVGIDRDHGRDRRALLELLRGGVERLAEFHDVDAALPQRRPDRRRRIGDARGHLQLDISGDFLGHVTLDYPSKWYFEGG